MYFQQTQAIQGKKSKHRLYRYLSLCLILLMHLGIILFFLKTASTTHHPKYSHKVLFLSAIPTRQSTQGPAESIRQAKASKINKAAPSIRIDNKNVIQESNAISTVSKSEMQVVVPDPSSEVASATTAIPLQKNIRELSLSLKEDFLKQEKNFRPDSKSSSEAMKKFSNAIADAAQIQREGVIIEKKFAYDGRPVSKIKTPYGTYCVRHPKAGEKPELSPPPIAVSCGQL